MKFSFFVVFFVFFVASETLEKNDKMQIYFLDTNQADSQLIVYPSGYSVLIDVGLHNNQISNAKKIANRVKEITGKNHVNAIVVTHYHSDHIGGVKAFLEDYDMTADVLLDRNAGTWYKDLGEVCSKNSTVFENMSTVKAAMQNFICYVSSPVTKGGKIRKIGNLCEKVLFSPEDPEISVQIVSIDGKGALDKKGNPVSGDYVTADPPPKEPNNENDYSLGLRFIYRDFSYLTCGDLDGEYASSFGSSYNDIESITAKRLGNVDLYKVNHHGSSHSSNKFFMETISPQASIIFCGTKNTYSHPSFSALERISAVNSDIFVTSDSCIPDYKNYKVVEAKGEIKAETDGYYFVVHPQNGIGGIGYKARNSQQPECEI